MGSYASYFVENVNVAMEWQGPIQEVADYSGWHRGAVLVHTRLLRVEKGDVEGVELMDLELSDAPINMIYSYIRSPYCKCKSLMMRNNGFTTMAFYTIAGAFAYNKSIETFVFSENKIGESLNDFQDAYDHAQVAAVYAMYGKDGPERFRDAMKSNTTLKAVAFENNSLGNYGCQCIAEAIEGNQSLTSLRLSKNGIGNSGIIRLAEALKGNTMLRTLDIDDNDVDDVGMSKLFDTLMVNPNIKNLNLRGNRIQGEGLLKITEFVMNNQTIEELNLRRNGFADNGSASFAKCLMTNKTLRRLHLSSNRIGDQGCIRIAEALVGNNAIQEVFLDINNIGDDGAVAVAEAIKSSWTLLRIDLRMNSFKKEGYEALVDAVEVSSSLVELHVSNSMLSSKKGCARILEVLGTPGLAEEPFEPKTLEPLRKRRQERLDTKLASLVPLIPLEGIDGWDVISLAGCWDIKTSSGATYEARIKTHELLHREFQFDDESPLRAGHCDHESNVVSWILMSNGEEFSCRARLNKVEGYEYTLVDGQAMDKTGSISHTFTGTRRHLCGPELECHLPLMPEAELQAISLTGVWEILSGFAGGQAVEFRFSHEAGNTSIEVSGDNPKHAHIDFASNIVCWTAYMGPGEVFLCQGRVLATSRPYRIVDGRTKHAHTAQFVECWSATLREDPGEHSVEDAAAASLREAAAPPASAADTQEDAVREAAADEDAAPPVFTMASRDAVREAAADEDAAPPVDEAAAFVEDAAAAAVDEVAAPPPNKEGNTIEDGAEAVIEGTPAPFVVLTNAAAEEEETAAP